MMKEWMKEKFIAINAYIRIAHTASRSHIEAEFDYDYQCKYNTLSPKVG